MKRLIAVCLTAVFFISASSFSLSIGDKEKVEVAFTNTLTYADLMKIKQDLFAKAISIDYRQLEFDKKKKLKESNFLLIVEMAFPVR